MGTWRQAQSKASEARSYTYKNLFAIIHFQNFLGVSLPSSHAGRATPSVMYPTRPLTVYGAQVAPVIDIAPNVQMKLRPWLFSKNFLAAITFSSNIRTQNRQNFNETQETIIRHPVSNVKSVTLTMYS